jgi:hypothetical protein
MQVVETLLLQAPQKDIWDIVSTISNCALAVVGIGGLFLAFRSLRTIERQTDIIERQTKTLVEGQRARIVALANGDVPKMLSDPTARRMEVRLENVGSTPALDLVYETWIEILRFPFEDFSPAATYFKNPNKVTVYRTDTPFIINIPIVRPVREHEWTIVRQAEAFVCVRIHLEYADSFGKTSVDFGY